MKESLERAFLAGVVTPSCEDLAEPLGVRSHASGAPHMSALTVERTMTFENLTDDEPISDEWRAPPLAVEARMGESDGTYRRLESLEEGIDGVGLWELPRFRPDLVAKRLGIPQRELRLLGALDDDPAAA